MKTRHDLSTGGASTVRTSHLSQKKKEKLTKTLTDAEKQPNSRTRRLERSGKCQPKISNEHPRSDESLEDQHADLEPTTRAHSL